MTNVADELGPVDWIVVEFPGGRFNPEIAPHLLDLVERGMIRVLDLVLVRKHRDDRRHGRGRGARRQQAHRPARRPQAAAGVTSAQDFDRDPSQERRRHDATGK